jgi:hypothetical protein
MSKSSRNRRNILQPWSAQDESLETGWKGQALRPVGAALAVAGCAGAKAEGVRRGARRKTEESSGWLL